MRFQPCGGAPPSDGETRLLLAKVDWHGRQAALPFERKLADLDELARRSR